MKLKINKLLTLCTAFCLLLTGAITGLAEEAAPDQGQKGEIVYNTSGVNVNGVKFDVYRLLDATTPIVTNPESSTEKLVAYEVTNEFKSFFEKELEKDPQLTSETFDLKVQEYISKNVTNKDFHTSLTSFINDDLNQITPVGFFTGNETINEYKISNLDYGYYVIVPNQTYGVSLFTVASDRQDLILKGLEPTADKTVGKNLENASAQIGEEVKYTVKSTVPNMAGFDAYYFKLVDTLSQGLTFKSDSVNVTVGDTNLVKDAQVNGFTVTQTQSQDSNTTQIIIEITNFKQQYEGFANQEIKFEYSAILNEHAIINGDNTNTAKVQFGNNPNELGESAEDVAKVYTHELEITKTDEDSNPLGGAKFKIYSSVVEGEPSEVKQGDVIKFVKEQTDPNTSNTYRVATTKEIDQQGSNVVDEVISGTNGKIVLKGLKAAKYFIEETKAPAGYNKLNQKIEYTIQFGDQQVTTLTLNVQNRKGTLLPETGGMGTVMFTVVGVVGILAVAYSFRPKKNK